MDNSTAKAVIPRDYVDDAKSYRCLTRKPKIRNLKEKAGLETSQPFKFLELPPELRNEIYVYLLRYERDDSPLKIPYLGGCPPRESPHHIGDRGKDIGTSVLRVCKQTHREASGLIYELNAFYAPILSDKYLYFNSIEAQVFKIFQFWSKIQHLRIEPEYQWRYTESVDWVLHGRRSGKQLLNALETGDELMVKAIATTNTKTLILDLKQFTLVRLKFLPKSVGNWKVKGKFCVKCRLWNYETSLAEEGATKAEVGRIMLKTFRMMEGHEAMSFDLVWKNVQTQQASFHGGPRRSADIEAHSGGIEEVHW